MLHSASTALLSSIPHLCCQVAVIDPGMCGIPHRPPALWQRGRQGLQVGGRGCCCGVWLSGSSRGCCAHEVAVALAPAGAALLGLGSPVHSERLQNKGGGPSRKRSHGGSCEHTTIPSRGPLRHQGPLTGRANTQARSGSMQHAACKQYAITGLRHPWPAPPPTPPSLAQPPAAAPPPQPVPTPCHRTAKLGLTSAAPVRSCASRHSSPSRLRCRSSAAALARGSSSSAAAAASCSSSSCISRCNACHLLISDAALLLTRAAPAPAPAGLVRLLPVPAALPAPLRLLPAPPAAAAAALAAAGGRGGSSPGSGGSCPSSACSGWGLWARDTAGAATYTRGAVTCGAAAEQKGCGRGSSGGICGGTSGGSSPSSCCSS